MTGKQFSTLFVHYNYLETFYKNKGFPGGSDSKESTCNARDPSQKDPLEKGMATHASIPSWRITCTEEPGGLYSSWGHKESDTTEQLTLSLFLYDENSSPKISDSFALG